MNVADIYAAAASAGMLTPVTIDTSIVQCGFRTPDEDVLGGLMQSRDYAIEYPTAQATVLPGDEVVIAGVSYRVREVSALRDGSETRATLARLT